MSSFTKADLNDTAKARLRGLLPPMPVTWMFGCWEWQGAKSSSGYGSFWTGSTHTTAHRAAFVIFVGPIPDGHTVDHDRRLCSSLLCCNPEHLRLLPNAENARDNAQAQRANPGWVPGELTTVRRAA